MDPTAQGQQPGAESQPAANGAGGAGTETPQPQPGSAEARINELMAQVKQYQGETQQVREQNALLMASLTEMATKSHAPTPQEPAIEVDADERAKIARVAKELFGPTLQRMEQLLGTTANRLGQTEFERAAAQVEDPRVVQRASQLLSDWQKRGLQGWTPENALVYARGEIAQADAVKTRQANGQRTAFNGATQVVPGTPGAPAMGVQGASAPVPRDIDTWPIEKQVEFWDKRSGNTPF